MSARCGIYRILHIRNGKAYIGSSVGARHRLAAHRYLLRRGVHHSPQLQRTWNRDGEDAFSFAVIEYCANDQLLKREQFWINVLQTANARFGYNICSVAGTRAGVPQPIYVGELMRAFHKGKPKSAEHRAKIGAGNRGKVRSAETRAAIAATVRTQMADPERRAQQAIYGAMGGGAFKGRQHTDVARAIISEKAKKRYTDPVRRAQLIAQLPKHSPEFMAALGKANGNRLRSQPRRDLRKLTQAQVLAIREAKAAGKTYDQLEEEFSINRSSLHNLITGKTYKMF